MIELDKVSVSLGELSVLKNISLEIPKNRVTVILGPSGCGKTTLLNTLSGTISPDAGEIRGLEGERISYCYQEDRLVPWKSLGSNLEMVLLNHEDRGRRRELTRDILGQVGLSEFWSYRPGRLSGGMKQRAALARAFLYPGTLLLLDEPFKGLDLKRKTQIMEVFSGLRARDSRTAVLVSHDLPEALLLGDQIVVLGDRPAEILAVLQNPVPVKERIMGEPELLELEKRIYKCMIGV